MSNEEMNTDRGDSRNVPKILLVVYRPVGGIRTVLGYLLGVIPRNRYRISIILPDRLEAPQLVDAVIPFGGDVVLLPERTSVARFVADTTRHCFSTKYDLVLAHGLTSGVAVALVSLVRRSPVMLTLHDVFRVSQFRGTIGRLKKSFLSLLFPVFDVVHSVSEDVRTNLLEFFPVMNAKLEKLVVIPNGIPVEHYQTALRDPEFLAPLGIGLDTFTIGFFGRIMPQKGFDILVGAIELLSRNNTCNDLRVLVFGSGDDYSRQVRIELESRGLSKYFNFMGYFPDICSPLQSLDCVAIPSRWEAGPLLAMESMAGGVPVVASDCIGLRCVTRDTPALIFKSGDIRGLVGAIEELIESPDRESEFVAFSTAGACRFEIGRKVAAWECVWDQILNRQGVDGDSTT